jgi:pimeloyl-ACP methyl ester carboxylesterase
MSYQTTIRPMSLFPALKCALLTLAIMVPATAPATTPAQSAQAVEKLVDVGGYNLNFRIIPGRGSAILLESGGGMDSTEWNALAPRLAQETGATVIAYDRAGFGKSDLPETKYDLREDTVALWRGLRTLGLDRNLILVGHSYGGFLIRFEAAEHPDAVRGLVFVDPFSVEFVDTFGVDYCNNHPMMGKLPFDTSRPETLSKSERAPGPYGRRAGQQPGRKGRRRAQGRHPGRHPGESDHRRDRFPPQAGGTEGLAGVPRAIDGIDQGRHNGRRREERPYDPV